MNELGIERDRWGRYLIQPPGKPKKTSYTRVTTIIKTIEDSHNLTNWKLRTALLGVAERDDLLLRIKSLSAEDKRELDRIGETAVEIGGGTSAATKGTAIHSILEMHDRGQYADKKKRPPAELQETITEYTTTLKSCGIKILHEYIETCLVNDELEYAGTVDRIVEIDGVRYIADIKTGKTLDFGGLAMAGQLAAYSRCTHATTDGVDRRKLPHVSQTHGLIIHIPSTALHHVSIHWVDLANGWIAFDLALRVRAIRQLSKQFILGQVEPLEPDQKKLPISDEDFIALKELLKELTQEQLAAVKAAWPKTIALPSEHAQGKRQILRGNAQAIKTLINKQRTAA